MSNGCASSLNKGLPAYAGHALRRQVMRLLHLIEDEDLGTWHERWKAPVLFTLNTARWRAIVAELI